MVFLNPTHRISGHTDFLQSQTVQFWWADCISTQRTVPCFNKGGQKTGGRDGLPVNPSNDLVKQLSGGCP